MKICNKCGEEKALPHFGLNMRSTDGLQHTCKECRNSNLRKYRANNRAKMRAANRKTLYGITQIEFDNLLVKQGGACAICHQQETVLNNKKLYTDEDHIRALCVDHNHATGNVRGLLCSNCNRALGLFGDSIKVLESAIQYLRASVMGTDNS